MSKTAVIVGAGPAGLTAAYELLTTTKIKVIVIEKSRMVGGISRTENYRGNRIDIGGHRFFSKSDRVMRWWQRECPKMLVRSRKSSIYFQGKLYDYPIEPTFNTFRKLGWVKTIKIAVTYLYAMLFPINKERSLEDFFINHFGRELYETFFKNYTQRLWGKPANAISAEWGAQRVKTLSISRAIIHFIKQKWSKSEGIAQKQTETSLINRFLYPPRGPGQVWEHIERKVQKLGGEVMKEIEVVGIVTRYRRVTGVRVQDKNGREKMIKTDYLLSSMPVDELLAALNKKDRRIAAYASKLPFRHFVTVGLLLPKPPKNNKKHIGNFADNWIYIHDQAAKVLRIQLFNNWSPYLVRDPQHTVWVGLEYTCSESDWIWQAKRSEAVEMAKEELIKLGLIDKRERILGGTLIKTPKTYPAYFGSYRHFPKIRSYLDKFPNLYPMGRNGMHHYNNQDHSMLTAMEAVKNIREKRTDKANIWEVNTESDYHEEKK